MTEIEPPKDIHEVILRIQQDPPILVKDKSGQVGSQKTKYADLEQVNEKVLPRLTALSTTYVCKPTMQDDGRFALEYTLRHVPSGTVEQGKYALKLSDNPQAMGSAITYARRYALLAALGIVAEGEDNDGRGEDGRGSAQRQTKRADQERQGQVAQRGPSGPPLPAEGNTLTQPQFGKIQALFREQGYATDEDKKAFLERVVKHPVASMKLLTKAEAAAVIDRLEKGDELPGGAR